MRERKKPISPQAQAVLDAFSREEITRVAAINQLMAIHKAEKRWHIRRVRLSDAEGKELKRITIEIANQKSVVDGRFVRHVYTIYAFEPKHLESCKKILGNICIGYERIIWDLYAKQEVTLNEVVWALKNARKIFHDFGKRPDQHIRDLEKINAARKALKEAQ